MSTATEDIPLGAMLTEEQARQILSHGEEGAVVALLELAKRLAAQRAALGMKPPYADHPPKCRGKKKPGRKKGRSTRAPGPHRLADGAPGGSLS